MNLTMRSLPFTLLTIVLAGCSAMTLQPTSTPPIVTRPVKVKESGRPLISTPGSPYTVTL